MIVISKVEMQKKHKDRVNIFVDDEFYTSMFLDTAVKYSIKKGAEIDEELFKKQVTESEHNLAFSKALKYMDTTFKTTKQIRDYLTKKGYDEIIVSNVISKLKEYNYINDEIFAENYISTYKSKYGKNMLKSKLISKGVSKEIIDNILRNFETKNSVIDKMLLKKIGNKPVDRELLAKCTRFLAGRGFSFDEINSAIRRLKNNTNIDEGEEYESWD